MLLISSLTVENVTKNTIFSYKEYWSSESLPVAFSGCANNLYSRGNIF